MRFGLTTMVCACTGALCSRSQSGFEDISITGMAGVGPENRMRPEMVPAVAGSMWASGRVAVAGGALVWVAVFPQAMRDSASVQNAAAARRCFKNYFDMWITMG